MVDGKMRRRPPRRRDRRPSVSSSRATRMAKHSESSPDSVKRQIVGQRRERLALFRRDFAYMREDR